MQLGTGLSLDSTNSGEPSIRNPSTCELEETQRDQLLGTSVGVQQRLRQKRDPQPSQDLFINSRSLIVQKRRTKDTIDHVNDVLGAKSKPPSVQTTDSSASSASKKLPKRQNSCSTDDETTSEYPLAKRHRSELKSHALHHMSLVSYGSVSSTQPAAILPPEASIDAAQGIQRQVCDIPSSSSSSSSHIGTGASTTQRDEEAGGITRRLVSPQDFEDACETCVFWLFSPEQFSSSERRACHGAKEEISHIITHATDCHGLIRGRDPSNASRKYLASCQIHDPLVKAKGVCVKCSSLHKWNDRDFMDPTHNGVVVCLRCWRKFSKKEMKEHIAGPICEYNAKCSKARKVWVLYSAFCSETQLPREPPKNRMPRKSSRQPSTQTIDQGQQQFDQDQTAGPSLLPFTIRKAVSLSHSPDLDETTWLSKEADDTDMDIDMGYMGFIGMNPNLQTPIQAADPLLLQPTNQRQELALESRLTAIQQTDLEKDSGYYSIYDTDLDKMFM